ncbi:hypothetical protein MP11Mi_06980 [Gordonia sp. MP11Mi]|uniref:Uncharacterized protein n=1 Tax=Gordonia sp. MP11Mi TaxID=3022769 RepID=A0AA97CSI1_9ACTN
MVPLASTADCAVYDPQSRLTLAPRPAVPGMQVDDVVSAIRTWLAGGDSSLRMHRWEKIDF